MRVERLAKRKQMNEQIPLNADLPPVVSGPESVAEYQQGPCDPAREEMESPFRSVALARVVEPSLVPAHFGAPNGLEAAFLSFLQSRIPSSPVPIERRLFLKVAEAAAFSGLPVGFLRQLIASGKLRALKTGGGWRISRVELEKLPGTLREAPDGLEEHQQRDMEVNRRRRQGTSLQTDCVPGIG